MNITARIFVLSLLHTYKCTSTHNFSITEIQEYSLIITCYINFNTDRLVQVDS